MTQTLPILIKTEADAADPCFAAQLMGQGGQRRGLRAGPLAIEAAQGAYRQREFSGPFDRRLPAGVLTKTAV